MPHQPKQIQGYALEPRNPNANPAEASRWRKFVSTFLPWLHKNVELSDRAIAANVDKMQAEARVAAETANKLAAEREAIKHENFRKFVEVIDKTFSQHSDEAALKLKLAKLIETFPELEENLAKIKEYESEYGLMLVRIGQKRTQE